MEGIVFILFIVAIIAGAIFLVRHIEAKRREAVRLYAQQMGFIADADVATIQQQCAAFKLFAVGRRRIVRNLIRGKRGDDEIAVCDYQYTSGGGKNSHTHFQTVCVVKTKSVVFPPFALRRQIALFDFLGKAFGGQDINFDTDPDFSKAYVLQTTSEEAALRDRFHESVRRLFTELAPKGVQAEANGTLLLFHFARQLPVERFSELVDDAIRVKDAFR